MTDKNCPLKHVYDEKARKCDGAKCQLWVKLMKDRILNITETRKIVDIDAEYIYEGCGLVTAIPWMLVNKVKEKEK